MELPKTSIEETISKLEIKKILVVDDTPEFIETAKKVFSEYQGILFEYASSEEQAKRKIKTEYDSGKKYDYVLTDMVLEKEDSGKKILQYASDNLTFGAVITRTFHEAAKEDEQGYKTALITPLTHSKGGFDPIACNTYYKDIFRYSKNQPELWKQALEWGLYRASTETPKEWMKMFNDEYKKIIKQQEDIK
ncbi:hypothetical protein K9L97_03185 [Candidatus Woesearchaeota archaeon]|nr:hypothetical protein [Candidatus Woesearchaeota archaeon]